MRKTRLTTTLVAVGLAATACGTASTPSTPPGSHPVPPVGGHPTPPTRQHVRDYARALLGKVSVPPGSVVAVHAPSKALEGLPESPSLSKTPLVLSRYWTVDRSATDVYGWLKGHGPGLGLVSTGSSLSTLPVSQPAQYLSYQVASLPGLIGAGYLYVEVIATGPSTAAIGAWAVVLGQPQRLATELVPPHPAKAVISWSLAPGGTPVLKTLTGAAAAKLASDFNALRVDVAGTVACPMIPSRTDDIIVTFDAGGHTWKADIPACPDIHVTRDGQSLPGLAFGKAFLTDVKSYTGRLPQQGPPRSPGGVIPLVTPRASH